MENINYSKLRHDLIDYFGTALELNPMAIMDIINIKKANHDELTMIAINNGFDLKDYETLDDDFRLIYKI